MIIENLDTRIRNALAKKQIYTDDDLVRWFPRRYKDYRVIRNVDQCPQDCCCAVSGILRSVESKHGTKQYLLLKVEPDSTSGYQRNYSVMLFSRTYLYRALLGYLNQRIVVKGRVSFDPTYGYSVSEPDSVILERDFVPRIETVYPKIGGVSDKTLRQIINDALEHVHEPFDWELMQRTKVIDYASALRKIHHPRDERDISQGKNRILFNDLLYFSLGLKKMDVGTANTSNIRFPHSAEMRAFISRLPFTLTEDQERVINDALEDVSAGNRLNYLVQGDVGSGKTAVAIALMVLAEENGFQSVLMAPRTVLAKQHYDTFLAITGIDEEKVAYLHSGLKVSERKKLLKKIRDGSISYVIGTHSCIAQDVEYHDLGLVVTDEEHLFGVAQKESIVEKARDGVHVISMSATPIPRTIASVLYGENKVVKQIRMKPAGRLPIRTAAIRNREKAFPFILQQIREGHQCYVVCPAIEDNEETDIVSIEGILADYHGFFDKEGVRIAVANGRMPANEAEAAVDSFSRGDAQILISTTVIEVGVNVPNATVILIEQADRFGLASLHQLRGRVGRSTYQSYCILRSDEMGNDRVDVMCRTNDGFEIAEADLQQRGTGDLLGVRQAGMNKYVDLMLKYPKQYRYAQMIAEFCLAYEFGCRFFDMMDENSNKKNLD